MNKAQKRPILHKVLSMILALVMVLSLMPVSALAETTDTANSTDEFMRIFHLDCGRKYFTVAQIEDLIDCAAENNYTHVELAIGNNGMRFLLDDMSVTVGDTTYTSEQVTAGIKQGNKNYYDAGTNELTQKEMSEIINYARLRSIEIIPLVNNPGHMDAIIDCMEYLGMKNVAFSATGNYGTSARTISLTNNDAMEFTKNLVAKYAKYFAANGCKYFNIGADEYANDILEKYNNSNGGMGFGYLTDKGMYSSFVEYVNSVASEVTEAGLTPMVFNDGVYYNNNTSTKLNSDIVVCYWTSGGWSGLKVATPAFIADQGHKLINTNDAWYYVLGRSSGSYNLTSAKNGVANTDVTTFSGKSTLSNTAGCMLALWCDTPSASYNDTEVSNVKGLISTLSNNNPTYFTETVKNSTVYNNTENTTEETDYAVSVTARGLTSLTVTETDAPTITYAADDKVAAYDVKPSTDAGAYTNTGTVSIKIPDGWNSSRVYGFVENSDGTVSEKIEGTVEDGYFTFTAPHFSVMGIYELSATAPTNTNDITLTIGETSEVYTQPGDVVIDVDRSNFDGNIAEINKIYYNNETTEEKTELGTKVTKSSDGTYTGVITDNNGNYLVVDSSGKISNTTDITKATKFTVTRSSRNRSTNYTIKGNNYYLRYNNNNNNLTTSTSSQNWSYSDNGEFSSSSRYLVFYNSSWTVSRNSSNPGFLYNVTTTPGEKNDQTEITFKGLAEGETSVIIGNTQYNITVTDAPPADAKKDTTITLGYWITNIKPYEQKDENAATSKTITSSEAASTDGIQLKTNIAPDNTYSKAFTNDWTTLYYWQSMCLDSEHQQTTDPKNDQTAEGTTITHVRFYNGAWQYKTTDGVWHYLLSGDQIVAYYLQKTDVTKEITTYVKDWGYGTDKSYESPSDGQVALSVAVVYWDGTVSPTEDEIYSKSTTIFNYWDGRDIGLIAPENNSDYTISKITVTNGTGYSNSGNKKTNNTWLSTDSIKWDKKTNAAGSEWYDETVVWDKDKNSGTTPMVNGKAKNITWSEKNNAKLILVYLEPVAKETNLNVVWHDDNANTDISSMQVVMKYNTGDPMPSFKTALKDGQGTDIGNKTNWSSNVKGNADYLPDDAYVLNSSENKQTFSKNLSIMQGISGIYTSGLYEYISADISEDGKTLTLHYNLKKTDSKVFVVDFGLPVLISASDFGITDINSVKTVSFDESDGSVTEKDGVFGHGSINKTAGTVTYTLTQTLDNQVAIPVYVTFNNDDKVVVRSVNIIPASTVYYEDSFATFADGDGAAEDAKWSIVDDSDKNITESDVKSETQALEALGKAENVYGYDEAYKNSTKYSMGSAHKVTVNSTMANSWTDDSAWPTATFTFKGTGFDIISLTDNTSGTIFVDVVNSNGETVKSLFVDNYYGYKLEGDKWVVDKDSTDALYQIPVMKVTGLAYDTYTVKISLEYDSFFDHTKDNKYTFVLDAIRVYDPMGESGNSYYGNDNEGYPQYIKLRDTIAGAKNSSDLGYTLFIDGADKADIATYANYGPNNEVYLASGQAISFKIAENSNIASIQIGAKAPDGKAANLVVNGSNVAENLGTATEMYYNITSDASSGNTVTISNTGDDILSLTNLKITYKDNPGDAKISLEKLSSEEQTQAVQAVRALFAAPVVEPFAPERFEAEWNSVRAGRQATLTVKTSTDVESITVNGVTVDSCKTRYERSGWGWWAQKVEYREFSYTVKATETTDYDVCAVNADGLASDPITATLTVKPTQNSWWNNWWNGIFDKWF